MQKNSYQLLHQKPVHHCFRYDASSVTLHLVARKSNKIPQWLGRAAQALYYSGLHDLHPAIATIIHDAQGPKPFTMSSLMGASQEGNFLVIRRGQSLRLRVTTLHPHMTAVHFNGILPQWSKLGITLHDQAMVVVDFLSNSQRIRYQDLLEKADDAKIIPMIFTSPTAFKSTSTGGFISFPQPELVFGSLLQRWNAFTSEPIPKAVAESIANNIVVVASDIHKETIQLARGRRGTIRGFMGKVEFHLNETDSSIRRYLNALAAFALYSGVGVKTTIGFGQVTPYKLLKEVL